MTARRFALVLGLALAAPCVALAASTTPPSESDVARLGSDAAPVYAVVQGLAPGDLLNVRANASPTGLLLTRLENGTPLKSFGCTPVSGYAWCRVEGVSDPGIKGWTPARYLVGGDPAPVENASAATSNAAAPAELAPDALRPLTPSTAGPTTMDLALFDAGRAGAERAAALLLADLPLDVAAPASTVVADAETPVPAPSAPTPPPLVFSAPAPIPVVATVQRAQPIPPTAQASAPARPSETESAAALGLVPPAVLVLGGFPLVLLLAMAAIASFGSFRFTSPFDDTRAGA